jgi:hypothetical protein
LPVLNFGGVGLIYPFSNACSAIAFSMYSMVTASLLILNTQLASQGAGQILPVNSGKLFVLLKIWIASSQRP